jgi:hypothetical protein
MLAFLKCQYYEMIITSQQADRIIVLLENIDAKLGKGMQTVTPPKRTRKKKTPAKSLKETIRSQFLKKYSNE